MKLHEYQSKAIFARYGIPVPRGRIASTASEARHIAEELGCRVIVKAQVLIGGRGKAGGILLAKHPKQTEEMATQILQMEIKGLKVRKVLVEEAIGITKEIYLGITIDRTLACPVMLASAAGGVDIEQVAADTPEKIARLPLHPLHEFYDFQGRNLAASIDLPREHWRTFTEIAKNLWRIFMDNDATLVEINPLVMTGDNHLLALDAKMVMDENAGYRHPELVEMRDVDEEAPVEVEAKKYGLSYIKLGGNIGCLVNGAGLAMATMDLIKLNGAEPANFLDVGGGASAERVNAAFRIILSDKDVKAILINIFGGITRCDEVARGILAAMAEFKPKLPMIVRLVGTNAEEGEKILQDAHIITATSLADAAQRAVVAAEGWSG